MKLKSCIFMLISLAFFAYACDEDAPTDVTKDSMKAKLTISGQESNFNSTSFSHNINDGKFNLMATTNDARITLTFPEQQTKKSDLGDQGEGAAIYTDLNTNTSYYAYEGFIDVKNFTNKAVDGNFTFKGVSTKGDSIHVVDGSFYYDY